MNYQMKASRAQEERGAKKLGGHVNPGSGNGIYRKNDVRTEDLSVEYKRTDKKQYTLKLEDLTKAERYALLDGRDMLFGLEIGKRDWIILPAEDYIALREQIRALKEQLIWAGKDSEPE